MSCQICHSWSCTCDPALLGALLTPPTEPPFPKYPAETLESMAEIGESFMDAMPKEYSWNQSPAEIINDLTNERDEAHGALRALSRAYVALMDNARERIVQAGGECDSLEVMERGDPYLRKAREVLAGFQNNQDHLSREPDQLRLG